MFPGMYVAQGQEQKTPWWQSFDVNRKPRSLWGADKKFHLLQVSKWSLWILILYTFLNYFVHVYSPGVRADKPLGSKFWYQQKALITSTICCNFQNNLFEFWFYTHFLMFSHMRRPGPGADNPLWIKFWCQQKGIVTSVASFQKISLKSDFIHIYAFLFLYKYIAPRQGQTTPWRQNFYFYITLLSLWSFAPSFLH